MCHLPYPLTILLDVNTHFPTRQSQDNSHITFRMRNTERGGVIRQIRFPTGMIGNLFLFSRQSIKQYTDSQPLQTAVCCGETPHTFPVYFLMRKHGQQFLRRFLRFPNSPSAGKSGMLQEEGHGTI
jgi:hypothetical protein